MPTVPSPIDTIVLRYYHIAEYVQETPKGEPTFPTPIDRRHFRYPCWLLIYVLRESRGSYAFNRCLFIHKGKRGQLQNYVAEEFHGMAEVMNDNGVHKPIRTWFNYQGSGYPLRQLRWVELSDWLYVGLAAERGFPPWCVAFRARSEEGNPNFWEFVRSCKSLKTHNPKLSDELSKL